MASIENGTLKFSTGEYRLIQRALEIAAKQWESDAASFEREPGHDLHASGARADAKLAEELAYHLEDVV